MNAQLAFTDSHVHFWDLREPDLHWAWLEREAVDPVLGDHDALKAARYWPDDFLAETRFAGVHHVVHVHAAFGTADPVDETRWLSRLAGRTGVPHAIVAGAELASPDAARQLERHLEAGHVTGIRDFRFDGYLADPDWERGYALLQEHDLVFCDEPAIAAAADAAALAARHPGITYCVNHAGTYQRGEPVPPGFDRERFARWRDGIRRLAAVQNTVVKISGLGMADHAWTVESLRPWVLECIDAWGCERAFFGTNWPVDRLFSSYGDIVGAYRTLVSEFSLSEQRALLSGNAERTFRTKVAPS